MSVLNALFTAAFDNNLVFAQIVGMVSVLLIAERPQDAIRFGGVLGAACFIAGLVGWPIYTYYLSYWGITYMAPAVHLVVSAAVIFMVGAIKIAMKPDVDRARVVRACVLLAINAAVLAVPLSLADSTDVTTFGEAGATALGSGLGLFIAVVLFASIRDRIDERLVPPVLRGLPISLMTAALMALAFTGVSGIAGGLFA